MSKKTYTLPINTAFAEFRQTRSNDTKKQIFKSLLETFVKMHLAVHVAWLLREKKNNVPLNIRVQLVQLFQKPPSLGFCNAISRSINKIFLDEAEKDSIWFEFARFFDLRQSEVARLIELRNADAHLSISIDKDYFIEIRTCLKELLSNPLFTNSSLIVASNDEVLKANIHLPEGLDPSSADLLLIKEELVYEGEEWNLNGKELCLLPLAIGQLCKEESAIAFFWNQRAGKRGIYSNYLDDNVENLEIQNITDLTGFPYEDWKRTANPIYLNYLQCRSNVLEDMYNDAAVGIEEWHNEYIVAKRLEKEVTLPVLEQISYSEYVKGILNKLKEENDQELSVIYHKKIAELREHNLEFSTKQDQILAKNIYASIVYLFLVAEKKKDVKKYNEYYKMALLFLPTLYYFVNDSSSSLKLLLGEGKEMLRFLKMRIWQMRIKLLAYLLVTVLSFCFFKGTLLICILIVWLLFGFFLVYRVGIKRNSEISEIITAKELKIKEIQRRLYQHILLITNEIKEDANPVFEDIDFEIKQIFATSGTFEKRYIKASKFNKANDYVFGMGYDFSDFEKIVWRLKFLRYFINTPKANNAKEISFSVKDRGKFMRGKFEFKSKTQGAYLSSCMNQIIFNENLILIKKTEGNIENIINTEFESYFFEDTLYYEEEWNEHNQLLGFISTFKGDFKKSIAHFKMCTGQNKFKSLYNLAQVYGATGSASNYFKTIIQLNQEIENLSEEENTNYPELNHVRKKVKDQLDYLSAKTGALKTSNLEWSGKTSFEFCNAYTYFPVKLQNYIFYFNPERLKTLTSADTFFLSEFNSSGGKYVGDYKDEIRSGYVGESKDDKAHGQGTFTWANGNKYEGEWKDAKRNGQGTFTGDNGEKYVGEWKDNNRTGQGTYTWANGDKYEGEWKDAKRNGQGTFTGDNGEKYVGEWKDNNRTGQGTFTWANGNKYEGEWKDDKRNGQGTFTWADGDKYEGEWKDGKQHGQGTFTGANGKIKKGLWENGALEVNPERLLTLSANGSKYIGDYKDDKKNGQGTWIWDNGDKYVGECKDDKRNGQGTFTWANGSKYEGEWKDGKKHGQGTFTWAKGSKYEGEWKDGKQHGQGTFTGANGKIKKGLWENGALEVNPELPEKKINIKRNDVCPCGSGKKYKNCHGA